MLTDKLDHGGVSLQAPVPQVVVDLQKPYILSASPPLCRKGLCISAVPMAVERCVAGAAGTRAGAARGA